MILDLGPLVQDLGFWGPGLRVQGQTIQMPTLHRIVARILWSTKPSYEGQAFIHNMGSRGL